MFKYSSKNNYFKFNINSKIYEGIICSSDCGYYPRFFGDYFGYEYYAMPLIDLHLFEQPKKDNLFRQILGYTNHLGFWPYCSSKQDVIKVLKYLSNLSNRTIVNLNLYND